MTSGGSANSHTAILARTMKIPAVVHTEIDLAEDWNGILGALDGSTGAFYLDPEPQVLEALKEKQVQHRAAEDALEQYRGKPTCTADGRTIALYGNIGQPEDVDLVKPEEGTLTGTVTHLIFKGVHYEMEVMANNYEWLVHSTDMFPVGTEVSIHVDPFDIQIMKKPESEDEEAVNIEE